MSIVGIIGAMEEEISNIKPYIEIVANKNVAGLDFYIGNMSGHNVILVRSGIGKVNASVCTQILIDLYGVDCIINVGVAGAIANELGIGDIVISEDTQHHDFDTTHFGDKLGEIPRMDTSVFKADKELVQLAKECAEEEVKNNQSVYIGKIVSGDQFVCDLDLKNNIKKIFKPKCVDMESASIGQVCYLNNVPFVVIRSISDGSDDNNPDEYENFFRDSAIKASLVLNNMINKIK
ncbi:MAG: 5'-methylthioadenosine/adenosylhomocysteine nucleosidase [bacterium]